MSAALPLQAPARFPRVAQLSPEEFIEQYLIPARPVVITGELPKWRAATLWTPEYLKRDFGDALVQVYGDYFDKLQDVVTLGEYFDSWFGRSGDAGEEVPYVRWYTQLKNADFIWADDSFERLRGDWGMPSFCPQTGYVMPALRTGRAANPAVDNFPARAMFISARGARTRLHIDPWMTDAILCQVHGRKRWLFYSPDQTVHLLRGGKLVQSPQAKVAYDDVLEPGEIIYVPRQWAHHVDTLTDSISVTWNFIHASTFRDFYRYLESKPSLDELEVVNFFVNR